MKRWKTILAGTLAAVMLVPAAAAAPSHGTLSDLKGHWAKDEIQQAIDDGWVDGYPDGTFKPEKTITRAEFTKMLLDATHLTPDSETVAWMKEFAVNKTSQGETKAYHPQLVDMNTHWLTRQGWLDAAMYSGMVVPDDYNNKNFRPEKAIARYEIALMADRAMGLVYPAKQPLTEDLNFTDSDQILDWMKGYISEAVKADVLRGYPNGGFGPNKTATRAEAVVMVFRALDYIEGDGIPDIKTLLTHDNYGEVVQTKTNDIRLLMADDRIYANVRDIFREEAKLRYQSGITDEMQAITFLWYPVQQKIYTEKKLPYVFQAGNAYLINGEYGADFDIYAGGLGMLASARFLYGEIMVPVYDLNKKEALNYLWEGAWDKDTNTVTIHTTYPDSWVS